MTKLTRKEMFDLLNLCEDRREHGEDTRFSTNDNGVVITIHPATYDKLGVALFLYVPFDQDITVTGCFSTDYDQLEVCDLTTEQAKEILNADNLWDTDDGYFDNVVAMVDSWKEVA